VKPVEFGDYTLIKKLATGGMGEVFLARQEQGAGFERYVAIKRILPELSGDDEFVRMFLDEARLAARLNHPNVVQIYDLGICGDQYYLAMEFLEGRDLRRIMGRLGTHDRALPGAHAVQIIYGAAEGLHYAHELRDAHGDRLNVIHRDVSPQNIFVTFHGTIKVLDFGIAKAEARSVRTKTGGLKGKYPYLSPEQVKGEEIDGRSDVFSLGTVLWEVTIGRRLFKRDNDLLTLQAVLQCEVPRPSELMANYPPELEAIVMRALARKAVDRYPTCRALQEDLEQFVGQFGLVLSPLKLGDFVKNLFSDEDRTVTDILDSLKKAPRSRSLLAGEVSEESDSFSLASSNPAVAREESTDPSASSADNEILADIIARTREEASGSHSSAPRPGAPSSTPPERSKGLADLFSGLEGMGIAQGLEAPAPPDKPLLPITAPPRPAPPVPDMKRLKGAKAPPPTPNAPPGRAFAPTIAVAPTSIISLPTSRPAPPADDDRARVIARAATAVMNVPIVPAPILPADSGARTPSQGTALPAAASVAGYEAAAADVLEPLDLDVVPEEFEPAPMAASGEPFAPPEPDEKLPRPDRLADLMALVRLWPKAALAAVFGAVVIPFAIVFTAISLGGGGDVRVAQPSPDAGIVDASRTSSSSILPPVAPPDAATIDAAPPMTVDAAPPMTVDAAPTVTVDAGTKLVRPPETRDGGGKVVPPRPRDGGAVSPPPPQPVGARGSLSLRIRPYADVFIDGRRVGLTPMPPVSLAPGRHRIRLVCDSLNRSILRTVTIEPGERVTLVVDMSD
jgi:serine/threonine protein kinase